MRRLLPATLLTAFLFSCLSAWAAAAAARDDKKKEKHPDLSGTWQLDKSKSDFGPFDERPLSKADSTLVVAHHDPELKITRTLRLNGREETKEFAYYTDERGETNQSAFGVGEVKSKTKWDGDKVLAQAHVTRRGQSGDYELDVMQKWQVSSDGRTLTHTTHISNQTDSQDIKLVYRRGA